MSNAVSASFRQCATDAIESFNLDAFYFEGELDSGDEKTRAASRALLDIEKLDARQVSIGASRLLADNVPLPCETLVELFRRLSQKIPDCKLSAEAVHATGPFF